MKEKIKMAYLILGLIVGILIAAAIFIWIASHIEINWSALKFDKNLCKKEIVGMNFDKNEYVKDLYNNDIFNDEKIEVISVITDRNTRDLRNLIKDEWYRLANQSNWEQMKPLKIGDLTGENINLDLIDFSKINTVFCQKPRLIRVNL